MGTMASQITSLTIVYLTVYSDADQRKHQSLYPVPMKQPWGIWGIHGMKQIYINELVQEKSNSIANALELRLFCTNPSIWGQFYEFFCHWMHWKL